MVDDAMCCLWAGEGDGRRGVAYAALASSFQVATLVLAIGVIRQRALRLALVVVVFYVAVTAILFIDGGGDGELWVNLVALTVAGLAIVAALLAVPWARVSIPDGEGSEDSFGA
jgi:hypothetical protein